MTLMIWNMMFVASASEYRDDADLRAGSAFRNRRLKSSNSLPLLKSSIVRYMLSASSNTSWWVMMLGWCSNTNKFFISCRIFGNVLNGSTFGITLHAYGGFQAVLPRSKHLNMVEFVHDPKAETVFMSYQSPIFPVSYGNTLGGVVRSPKLELG